MKTLFILALLSLNGAFAANHEGGGRLAANAVMVRFSGPGNGIDRATLQFAQLLIKFADEEGQVAHQTTERYGREGETSICVQFKEGLYDTGRFIAKLAPSILIDSQSTGGFARTTVHVGRGCEGLENAAEQDLKAHLAALIKQ